MRIRILCLTTAMASLFCQTPVFAQSATSKAPAAPAQPAPDDSLLIDQKEFDAAIPPLDPEMSRPLESLDDFAKQMAAGAT
ncbi:MAG: hypothetical protein ABIQ66_09905, partial [Novosphingobium sp.]